MSWAARRSTERSSTRGSYSGRLGTGGFYFTPRTERWRLAALEAGCFDARRVPSQDEDIRALERAVSETPTDGQARVRLAHALGRKGRRDDAIRALDLASFPDDGFLEARALADELWRAELSALELAKVITLPAGESVIPGPVLDPTGRFVAFLASREPDVRTLRFCDTLTERELDVPWGWHEGVQEAPDPFNESEWRGPIPLLVFTDRAFFAVNEVGTVLEVSWGGANLETVNTRPPGFMIDEFSPEGDLVLARGPGSTRGVHLWPSRRPVITRERIPGWAFDGVCWSEQLLITAMPAGNDGLQIFQLTGFDGMERALLGPNRTLESLGAGMMMAWEHERELSVHDLRSGREIEIAPRSWFRDSPPRDVGWPPSLASDERTLRLTVRNVPRCVTLDRAKGCLTGNEDIRSWFMTPGRTQMPPSWHPHTAALFVGPLGEKDVLVQLPAERIFEIPAEKHAGRWSGDGHTVVVTAPTRRANRIELWRTPTGRARFS